MGKHLFALTVLILITYQPCVAQTIRHPVSPIYIGLGAYSTKQNDVFSFSNNQAALVQIKEAAVGVYSERRFSLAATSLYTAVVAIPSTMGNFGVSLDYAGFKNFNESQLGLAYARSLGAKVDIGIQFNYYGYRVPGYTHADAINFEIGAMAHLTDQLNMGLHVYNPVGGKFAKSVEKLTTGYTAGLGYDASDRFFVSAAVVKEKDYAVAVHAGMQYQFMKQFFVRAGIATASAASYAGVGVSWSNLRLDISGSHHPQLGWSPGLLLIMSFGNYTAPPATREGMEVLN